MALSFVSRRVLMSVIGATAILPALPAMAAFEFIPPAAPVAPPAAAIVQPQQHAVIPPLMPSEPTSLTAAPAYHQPAPMPAPVQPAAAPVYAAPAPAASLPQAMLQTGTPVHVAPRVSPDVTLAPAPAPIYNATALPVPTYGTPAAAAPVQTYQPAPVPPPASAMVDRALGASVPQAAPQSILPTPVAAPAPTVSQHYTLSPSDAADIAPRTIRRDRSAAPQGAAVLNMNPLGLPQAAATQNTQTQNLEQAMVQGAEAVYAPAAAPVSASSVTYAEAIGFGRELPLALAVSQIVPPDYAFTFDPSVNPGDAVSWEGGKAWNTVLQETLAASGATARIDDMKKEVTITASGAPASAPVAYSAPAIPAPSTAPVTYQQTPRPPVESPAPAPMLQPAVAQTSPKMQLVGLDRPGVLDPKAVRLWEAQRGQSLRTILRDWSMQAGVELFWSSNFDFPVESSIRLESTFEDAVQTLLSGLRDAQPRPIGRLHPNLPEGPSVLVIETRHTLE